MRENESQLKIPAAECVKVIYILDKGVLRLSRNPLSRRRRIGLWVIRRSITFCLSAERTFKLGSEAENKNTCM